VARGRRGGLRIRKRRPLAAFARQCDSALTAHPEGLVVGEIGSELGIPPSTLSHHLDKLKNEGLVAVRRESTFLRYTANTKTLQDIVGFLFAECCTRNKAIRPEAITACAC
jgi:DNA-binding transcriptional ArsR family regulator